MNGLAARLWLQLACLVAFLRIVAALDILYPKIGTIYPATGPDNIQWQQNDEEDPQDLAIYLATWKGQNVVSEKPCINASLSDGSTAVTLTKPAPEGDSWTFTFYDNDEIIILGYWVAQSVHFEIEGATATPSPTSVPGAVLSPAVAAAAGVGGTVVVVIVGLLIGYCCIFKRRQRRKQRETINAVPYEAGHRYSRQQLDSKPITNEHGFQKPANVHEKYAPTQTHHEMGVYPGTGPGTRSVSPPSVVHSPSNELSTMRHSHLPQAHPQLAAAAPFSPVSPVGTITYNDQRRVFAQELPGDSEFVNTARNKEWKA